jgi:hypothetical protein
VGIKMIEVNKLSAKEVHTAIKDVRRSIRALAQAAENNTRIQCLTEVETLYSLVFDLRALIQQGGTWNSIHEDNDII